MKRFGHLKDIRLVTREFKDDLGCDNFIFVGSSTDMFASDVPSEWISATLENLNRFPENGYLLQSKNPARMIEFVYEMPPNTTLCTTIETNRENDLGNAPLRSDRLAVMHRLKNHFPVHVTLEPIMDFDVESFSTMLIDLSPEQINIGSNTSNTYIEEPPKDKIIELMQILRENNLYVHEKDNLKRLLK